MKFTLNGIRYKVCRKWDKTFHLANYVYKENDLVFIDYNNEDLKATMMYFVRLKVR